MSWWRVTKTGAHQILSVRMVGSNSSKGVEGCHEWEGMHFCLVKAKNVFRALKKVNMLHQDTSDYQEVREMHPERQLPSHLVVIAREGVAEVTPFTNEDRARKFYVNAGAQWSETFLCEVLEGPLV